MLTFLFKCPLFTCIYHEVKFYPQKDCQEFQHLKFGGDLMADHLLSIWKEHKIRSLYSINKFIRFINNYTNYKFYIYKIGFE